MNPPHSCPPQAEWERIVGEGFADFSSGDLSAHLERCPACQAAVESLISGEHAWVAIATELRQDLPPASVVCQKTLEGLKQQEPSASFLPAESTSSSEAGDDEPSRRVYCPHCLEMVHLAESLDGGSLRCPLCWRTVDATGQEATLANYQVDTQAECTVAREVQAYVHSLEKRARKERKEKAKAYERGGWPMDLIAGLFFMGCGVLVFAGALMGGGMMSLLVNGVLLSVAFFLVGALCLVFRRK